MANEATEQSAPRTLADRVDWLFRNIPDTETQASQPYSYARLAAKIQRQSGLHVTPQTLWSIRTGTTKNPSHALMKALAKAFGVSLRYFEDEDLAAVETRAAEEFRLLALMKQSGVKHLAERAAGLNDESLAPVIEVLELVRRLKGLPPVPSPLLDEPPQSVQDGARPSSPGTRGARSDDGTTGGETRVKSEDRQSK